MKWITLALLMAAATANGQTENKQWYTFSIGGHPVGYTSESHVDGRTATELKARISRLGSAVEMEFQTVTIESGSGDFESLSYDSLLSKQKMHLEAAVKGDQIVIRSSTDGAQTAERAIPRGTEQLLGPIAVARLTHEKLGREGDTIDYTVFSPELQQVAKVRRRVVAKIAPPCSDDAALEIEETIDGLEITRTAWLGSDGSLVADSLPGPFGPMTDCRSNQQLAEASLGAGDLPADLYERSTLRANVRLADPASVDRLVVRVKPRDGSPQQLAGLAGDHQTVRLTSDAAIVEIQRPSHHRSTKSSGVSNEFLASNAFVESANPEIVKIADTAAGSDHDPYSEMQKLTRWVSDNMSMDAGVVMAPASELVRDRKGTCMGYATLLASLARARQIPSRIAMGYVYYGGMWGGHAWTEAHIGDRWLPFDAAVYEPGVASATRLAAGTSSFQDGGGSLFGHLGTLFNSDVEIVEYGAAGHDVQVPSGREPFTIAGSTYINPGLGLRINADGYVIEHADSTWPSSLLVSFRSSDATIELHQESLSPTSSEKAGAAEEIAKVTKVVPRAAVIGPYRGWIATENGKSLFAAPDGSSLWLWTSNGKGAETKLRQLLGRTEKKQSS